MVKRVNKPDARKNKLIKNCFTTLNSCPGDLSFEIDTITLIRFHFPESSGCYINMVSASVFDRALKKLLAYYNTKHFDIHEHIASGWDLPAICRISFILKNKTT